MPDLPSVSSLLASCARILGDVLPVLAISGSDAALAQHRLKKARSTVPAPTTDADSAYGQAGLQQSLDQYGAPLRPSCTYQGGPKTGFWTCRYR